MGTTADVLQLDVPLRPGLLPSEGLPGVMVAPAQDASRNGGELQVAAGPDTCVTDRVTSPSQSTPWHWRQR